MKKVYSVIFNICFACLIVGFVGISVSMYVVCASGSATAQGLPAAGIDASVAFVKAPGSVVLLNLKDGSQKTVAGGFSKISSVSLDRKREKVVIAGVMNGKNGVYAAETATGAVKPVVEKKEYCSMASISADGARVAFVTGESDDPFHPSNVVVCDIAGKNEKALTHQAGTNETNFFYNYPKFTKDGASVICSKAYIPDVTTPKYESIYVVKFDLAAGSESVIIGGATEFDEKGDSKGFKASAPSVLDDGRIGFLKTVAHTEKFLAIVDPAKNNAVEDVVKDIDLACPSFSPDGKYIVFEVLAEPAADAQPKASLAVYDIAAKAMKKVAEEGLNPSF